MELIYRQIRLFRGMKRLTPEARAYEIYVPLAPATRAEALPRLWIPFVPALA